MSTKKSKIPWWHFLILGAWLAWLTWHWLPQPLLIDEVVFAQVAHAPFMEFGHPPAYLHALGILALGLKLPDVWLRAFGLVLLLLTAGVVYRLAERFQGGAGVWAIWLLLTNPLALRGAFVLDIDNTLLTWWVVTSIWWLVRARWPLGRRTIIAFGVWWALGLWMKLTTPWLWPVALWMAYGTQGRWRQGLGSVALMSGVGLVVFLLAWTFYSACAYVPWATLFSGRIVAMILRGATDRNVAMVTELAERATRIGLWVGPLTVLLWVAGTWHAIRHHLELRFPQAWVVALALGWGILLGYWVIGGVIWSLARYHCPLVPLIAVVNGAMIAHHVSRARVAWVAVGLSIIGMALWVWYQVGDPLHLVNYELRHALLFSPADIRVYVKWLAISQVSLILLVVAAAILIRRWQPTLRAASAAVLALTLGAIGSGLGMAARQSTAPYSTSYCYGRPWRTHRAIQRYVLAFHAAYPQARIMAPFDTFQGQIPFEEFLSVFVNEWFASDTVEKFLAAIDNPRTGLCVMDVDFSSARAVKELWGHPQVQALLQRDFLYLTLGTADGWVRRSLVSQPEPAESDYRS